MMSKDKYSVERLRKNTVWEKKACLRREGQYNLVGPSSRTQSEHVKKNEEEQLGETKRRREE